MALLSTTGFTFPDIDLTGPMQAIVDGASDLVVGLIPIGIGIILVLAIPRIISRVVRSFI
jgi:hypothetical protein